MSDYTPTPDERRVIEWLVKQALKESYRAAWPAWKYFLWSLLHPFKFEASYQALCAFMKAINAIEQGHPHDPE